MADPETATTESSEPASEPNTAHSTKGTVNPQYGLLGFDIDNCDEDQRPEPIPFNTNGPSSVFLCGAQGSGKSYTLSCILENHLLNHPGVGRQHETIPGFVFH